MSNKFFILLILAVYGTVIAITVFSLMLPVVYSQAGTPAQQTTIQGPNAGNIQFLPQQAYIVPLPPAGVPVNNNQFGNGGDSTGLLAAVTGIAGIGTAMYAKITGDKKIKPIAQTQVKLASVQQGTLEQVYDIMPQKGNEITNKPEIKLSNVEKIKDEALKNAAKV